MHLINDDIFLDVQADTFIKIMTKFLLIMKKFLLFFASLFLLFSTSAEVLKPVKWTFDIKYPKDGEAVLYFNATIDKGWHVYAMDLKPDGPIPTSFSIDKSPDFELMGSVQSETKPTVKYDSSFMMKLGSYGSKAVFYVPIKIKTTKNFQVKGHLQFMCCNDKSCLPPEDVDFMYNVNGAVNVPTATATDSAVNQSSTVAVASTVSAVDSTIMADNAETADSSKSLWMLFWLSIVAGLLAILTPCVFPMIPMTVSFFIKGSANKIKGRINALVYGFSIIFIYVVIGTLVAVTLGANFANFLSTHWLPNIIFFLVFMVFAASFFGMFEIVLPSSWVNKADKQVDRGGLVGSFFMAFTLVLVSFSCTGPLVGAILVQSAGGSIIEPVVGMFGFSLAFALPFTLFAFFPQWLNGLPKSGGWLNSVKVVLGFIELALGLKFLSIADQTYHWGILDREVYLAFWIVIFSLMGMYLLGKIKLAHDSELKSVSVPRLMLAMLTFTFVVYLIPGMFGAPLKAISGYLPPVSTQDFDVNAIVRDNAGAGLSKNELCENAKYSEFLHLPHGLKGYYDYDQALKCSKESKKPIFIDFTGHGCVNCREMEASVWADPRVLNILRKDYIVVALYVDDKTELPQSEWVTSKYDGKVKKTIGQKYADFQIERFSVNAQPYYVLLDSNGENLVDAKSYDKDVENFIAFLNAGKAEFEKRK